MLTKPSLTSCAGGHCRTAMLLASVAPVMAIVALSGGIAAVPSPVHAQSAAASHYTVDSIDVVGATLFSPDEIETIVYPFTGENRTNADLEAARKALQDAYARRGYEAVIVELPEQDPQALAAGVVRITVAEAPVGKVRVTGEKHHSAKTLLAEVPSIVPGKPVNLVAVQQDLQEVNRIPDQVVTPSFKPASNGAIDVDLKVKDTLPLHASAEINNDNSPNTRPLRVNLSARYTNLWGLGHTISGTYIMTPQEIDQTKVISGSYNAPLLGTPLSLLVFGYKSNSAIAALGGSNVLGNGYQVGVRAIYHLSSQATDQSFSIGFDYKSFNQNIFVDGAQASSSPIHYIPLSLGYGFNRATAKSEFSFNAGGTLGLRVIRRWHCPAADGICTFDPIPGDDNSVGYEDQFNLKDYQARENFAHLNIDFTYMHTLLDDMSATLRFTGQYADSHLVTNEQFSLGGESTVRGYMTSEAVGDRGMGAQLEVAAPSLATLLPEFVTELRPFVFTDAGIVGIIEPLPDVTARFKLASVGGGLRYRLFKHVKGSVTAAVPLIAVSPTRVGETRVTFSAKGEF